MAEEHTERADSDSEFTPANYELTSTSRIEHGFVATPHNPPEGGFPVEQKIVRMKQARAEIVRTQTDEGLKRPSLAAL